MHASVLKEILERHIEKHGDQQVMLYDEYAAMYKSFSMRRLSVMPGGRLVIECKREESK